MNPKHPPTSTPLERQVAQQLHDLPLRRAPPDLQARVLATLQQHAALPWWRQTFIAWPIAARLSFVLLCLVLANAAVSLTRWLHGNFQGTESMLRGDFAHSLSWAERIAAWGDALVSFVTLLMRHMPLPWLLASAMLVAMLYGVLLGLGATAYRTLYSPR